MSIKLQRTETNPTSNSQPRFLRDILKAIGGATVATLSLLSLCLTSAQAASFVTTFSSDFDLTLEWSGSDLNVDGTIDGSELSGPVSIIDPLFGNTFSLGSPSSWDFSSFSYDTATNVIGSLKIGTIRRNFEFQNNNLNNNPNLYIFKNFKTPFDLIQSDIDLTEVISSFQTVRTTDYEMDGGGEVEATPEPTLTLGLITLGGLMLGSRKKEKA